MVAVNDATNGIDLLFGKEIRLSVAVYPRLVQYSLRGGTPDSVNIRESYLYALVFGQINACDSCQCLPSILIPDAACAEDSHR